MSLRVLIVDDDELTLSLFLELVSSLGYASFGASTAAAAFEQIDRQQPDVVLSDWDLGEQLSGVHVAEYVRRVSPACHLIMMTGRDMEPLVRETASQGVYAYLKKPFSLVELSELFGQLT